MVDLQRRLTFLARCSPPSTKRARPAAPWRREFPARPRFRRLGHGLDAGGDIDAIAEDGLGLLVDDHLAQMQPDAEHQALFLVERSLKRAILSWMSIAVATAAIAELNSARMESAAMFDDRPPAVVDRRPPDLVVDRLQVADRRSSAPSIRRTKPYTPRTNGKAERFIQTSLRESAYARAYLNSRQRAHELPFFMHRYNWHRPHASIGTSRPSADSP